VSGYRVPGITEPNDYVAEVHERMPVLLTEKDFEPWLQGEAGIAACCGHHSNQGEQAFQRMPQAGFACMNDAVTICGQFIPDRERVAGCLISNRSNVSAACRSALTHFNPQTASAH
jgi:hypothetical protein